LIKIIIIYILAFEDLLYILNKYLLLKLLQEKRQKEATSLFQNYICNHIQNEIEKGGSRAEWFNKGNFFLTKERY